MTDFNKKRYIVVSSYPTSADPIGRIRLDGEYTFDMGKYPHLYRLMEWWEYRSPEEMPICVQKTSSNDGYFGKDDYLLVEWVYNQKNLVASKGKSKWVAHVSGHYINADSLLPKTKEDYDKAPKENKPSAGSMP